MAKFRIPDDADVTSSGARPLDGTYLFKVIGEGPKPADSSGGKAQLVWPLEVVHALPGFETQVGRRYTHRSSATTAGWFRTQDIFNALNYKGKPGQEVDGEKFVGQRFGGILRTAKRKGMDKEFQDIDTVLSVGDYKVLLERAKQAAKTNAGFDDEGDDEEEEAPRKKRAVNGASAQPVAVAKKRRPEPEPEDDDEMGDGDDFDGASLDDDDL